MTTYSGHVVSYGETSVVKLPTYIKLNLRANCWSQRPNHTIGNLLFSSWLAICIKLVSADFAISSLGWRENLRVKGYGLTFLLIRGTWDDETDQCANSLLYSSQSGALPMTATVRAASNYHRHPTSAVWTNHEMDSQIFLKGNLDWNVVRSWTWKELDGWRRRASREKG